MIHTNLAGQGRIDCPNHLGMENVYRREYLISLDEGPKMKQENWLEGMHCIEK